MLFFSGSYKRNFTGLNKLVVTVYAEFHGHPPASYMSPAKIQYKCGFIHGLVINFHLTSGHLYPAFMRDQAELQGKFIMCFIDYLDIIDIGDALVGILLVEQSWRPQDGCFGDGPGGQGVYKKGEEDQQYYRIGPVSGVPDLCMTFPDSQF